MIKKYLLLLFLVTGIFSFAQENVSQIPDSLKNQSFEELEKKFYAFRPQNLLTAKLYSSTMLQLALQKENATQIYTAEYCNARIESALGNKEAALDFINKAIQGSKKSNDSTYLIKSLFVKGKIYADFGEYMKATDYYTKVCELTKNDPDQTRFHIIAHNIAIIKNQIGDNKRALEISKKNLAYFESKGEKASSFNVINCYLILVSTYSKLSIKYQNNTDLKRKYLDSSMMYAHQGIKVAAKYNDNEAATMLSLSKGINYYELNEFDRCLESLKSTESKIIAEGLLRELPLNYLYQGKALFSLKNYDKAIVLLKKALEVSETQQMDMPNLQESLILLAKSYEGIGDAQNTIKYLKLSAEKDHQNDLLTNETTKTLYEKYDIPSLENKIQRLEKESNVTSKKYTYVRYIAWILLFVLLAIAFVYKKRQYQYKKRFHKLVAQINTLERQQKEVPKEVEVIKPEKDVVKKETSKKQPKIADDKVTKILNGLKKFEEKEQFLSNKCTLNYVAKKVHTNSTYFSIVLQTHKKKKFVQYITDLRIEYALKRLKNDSLFRSYDVKSIANEVGFNTSESFSKAFKKRTGIYPSFYIKNLDKLEDS